MTKGKWLILIPIIAVLWGLSACTSNIDTLSPNEIISVNETQMIDGGYLEGNGTYIQSSSVGRKIFQDVHIISEAQELIKKIPIPVYYSEYNGKLLDTSNVSIQVSIYIYDYLTGEAILCATALIPDENIFYIRLVCQEPPQSTSDLTIYHCSRFYFTLGELKSHSEWFTWEYELYEYKLYEEFLD